MDSSVSERALGQLPLSIATSLAIESAFGIHPEIQVKTAPILKYKQLWINLKTLFRNFEGAIDSKSVAPSKDVANGLLEEIDKIKELVSEYTNGNTKVIFYVSNYKGMEKKYKHAQIRGDTTPLQREYTHKYSVVISQVLKAHMGDPDFKIFDLKLEGLNLPSTMILTHIPYDLVSHRIFSELVLLESHTGKIKDKSLWYTKYLNGNQLSIMPFREDLLQVFGDKETFRPLKIDLRNQIIAIAEKYKWSSATTTDKIRYGLSSIANPFAREVLMEILVN